MEDKINDQLLKDLKAGDTNAFDTIFKKYYPLLIIETRGYFSNNYLAEEIVCDVFTKIWINRKELTVSTSLRGYLVKAIHNKCIDYLRNQKIREKVSGYIGDNQQKAFTLTDIGQNPLEYTISAELENNLMKAVELLPPRYKQAFILSRFQDKTYEEIAIEMGISIDGVKMNIKKALAHLRDTLKEYLIIILLAIIIPILKEKL
jgi:RNA polymerase sigma-70 factor (family 1)